VKCPRCGAATKIEETRATPEGDTRRYRRCTRCHRRFATVEQLDIGSIVVEKGGTPPTREPEPFDRLKLRKSLRKASVRKLPNATLDEIVDRVIDLLFADRSPDAETTSVTGRAIGRALLDVLAEDRRHAALRLRYALLFGPSDGQFHDAAGFVKTYFPDATSVRPSPSPQQIVKRDGKVEPFSTSKLRESIAKGISRRDQTHSVPIVDAVTQAVVQALETQHLVTAAQVASETLRVLNPHGGVDLDSIEPGARQLAYLRIASTAKGFQTEDDFIDEAASLIAGPAHRNRKDGGGKKRRTNS
jgi:transcriptional regulator NrdR family protein